jgi:hypothetical protein
VADLTVETGRQSAGKLVREIVSRMALKDSGQAPEEVPACDP